MNSMDQERRLSNIEYYIAQNSKSIDNIAYLLKSLNYSFENSGLNSEDPELLKRIEARLERISRSDASTLGDLFIKEMKKGLDERQKFLNSKMLSIEELIIQIGEFANKKVLEFQHDTTAKDKLEDVKISLSRFNSDFSDLKNNLYSVEDKMSVFLKQDNRVEKLSAFIAELQPFLEKFHSGFDLGMHSISEKFVDLFEVVEKLDSSGDFESVKHDLDNLNLSVNAVMSAIQLVEFKYKDIQESFEKLAKNKDVQAVQANIVSVVDKMNVLNEIMQLVSTTKDIEELKKEFEIVTGAINGLKDDISDTKESSDSFFQQTISTLNDKFENVFAILSESKTGSSYVNQKVDDLDAKLDNFQEILLKLLAIDNVDLVKKDIQDISIRINSLNELIKSVAAAKTVDDIKKDLDLTLSVISGLKTSVNDSVIESLKQLSEGANVFNDKIDNLISISQDASQINELKDIINSVSTATKNTEESLTVLLDQTIIQEIKNKVEEIPNMEELYTFKDDLSFMLGKFTSENDTVRGDLYSVNTTLNELLQSSHGIALKSDVKEEISTLLSALESNHSDIKNSLNLVSGDIISKIEETCVKEQVDSLLNELKNEESKIESLKNQVLDKIEDANVKEQVNNLLTALNNNEGEIKNLKDEVLGKIEDANVKEQVNNLLTALNNNKGEIKSLKDEVFDKIENINVTDQLDNILAGVENLNNSSLESLKDELHHIKDDIISNNLETIDKFAIEDRIQNIITNSISEGNEELISEIQHIKADILAESNDGHKKRIEDLLAQYKIELEEISSLTDQSELKTSIDELGEKFILQVIQLFENISFIEEVEEIKEVVETSEMNLSSEIQSLKQFFNGVKGGFQDKLNEGNISNNLMYEIHSLREFLESLKLQDNNSLKASFIEVIDNFVDLNEKIEDNIKDDLKSVNNNISEVLDEIKLLKGKSTRDEDYIYSLDDVQSDFAKMRLVLDDITKSIGLGNVDGDIADKLKENIGSMTDMLECSQENLSGEQVDGLKDDFQEVVDLFNDMNKEVYDISLRTNKLILTSQDSNQELKNNLASFREVINNIYEKADPDRVHSHISTLQVSLSELKKSVGVISQCSNNNLQSIEFVKEALIYMAEWIDGSGELLNQISFDTQEVKNLINSYISASQDDQTNERINELTDETANIANVLSTFEDKLQTVLQTVDNDSLRTINNELGVVKEHVSIELNKISERFFSYETKFDNLERKIEVSQYNRPKADDEIKSLLEYIAGQASAANENARLNTEMLARIQNLENKVSAFDTSIKKLVSFVDED